MADMSQTTPLDIPLTPMQQGMLFATLEAGAGAGVYIEQAVARFGFAFNPEAFESAWRTIIARHDALRLQFSWKGQSRATQSVNAATKATLRCVDWSQNAPQGLDENLTQFLLEDRRAGIDLESAPLHRATAFILPSGHWSMVWTVHHAIVDGRGIATVLRDFIALYCAFAAGESLPQLPTAGSFAAFAAEEAEKDWAHAADFWHGSLSKADEPTAIPLVPPTKPVLWHEEVRGLIDAEDTAALRKLAKETEVSTSTLVHAAWALLLHRYTGQDTVAFGATRALRGGAAVGLHINTLPIAAAVDRTKPLRQFLAALRSTWLAQRAYAGTPLAYVQQWVLGSGAKALFDTYVVHERGNLEDLTLCNGARPDIAIALHERTPSPLTLAVYERETIEIHMEFDARRFNVSAMRRLLSHFLCLLTAMPANADSLLGELPMFSPEELAALRPPAPSAPPFEAVHMSVTRCSLRTPSAPAVIGRETSLDYAALERKSNQIAHALLARGVRFGDIVAFMLPRCPEAIATMVGILKAGAAYLPLDPGIPAERRAFKLTDSAARLTVTLRTNEHAGPLLALHDEADFIAVQPDVVPPYVTKPEDPAYVIYTSGSTGQPKGVLVHHGALSAFVAGACQLYGMQKDDRVLQFAALNFDAAAEEIYPTLMMGATLVLRNDEMIATALGFVEQCRKWEITVLDLPTAYWHVIVDSIDRIVWPKRLRLLIIGGEAARPDKVRAWCAQPAPRPRLANTYGPTETTVAVTCAMLDEVDADRVPVPIGTPFPAASVYVLDVHGDPVPEGTPGELWIGGPQLALGYLNREDLTEKVFAQAGWDPSLRLYRTGDRVYQREDGALVYLERADRQVKLRGFRIELGEIESVLRVVQGVAEAAVLLREDQLGMPALCAYLSIDGESIAKVLASARQRAEKVLPAYMQPAHWIPLTAMPMTTSGKIDRNALPAPVAGIAQVGLRAPRTEMEELVHTIWCTAFAARALSCEDDFLALGGHSLLATQIVSRVVLDIGIELTLAAFARNMTIEKLAAHLEAAPRSTTEVLSRLPAGSVARLAPDQEILWVFERLYPGTPAYHIPVAFEVRGAMDLARLERALHIVVERHDALRSAFALLAGAPAIVVSESVHVPWRIEHASHVEDDFARAWLAAEASRPFDIACSPLLRVAVLSEGIETNFVCLTLHHLISDGWSVGVLTKEWSEAYAALSCGQTPVLPELALLYIDVAAWRATRGSIRDSAAEQFWQTQLAPPVPCFDWPSKPTESLLPSPQGVQYPLHFSPALSDALGEIARAQGATPFALFFSLFAIALHRYTAQNESVIGFSLASRTRPELEPMIGFFLSTLLLRVSTEPEKRFDVFLRKVRDGLWRAQENQETPFARLRALGAAAHAGHSAPTLLQVLFLMQTMPLPPLTIEGAITKTLNVDLGKALTDIALELYPSSNGFTGWFEYQFALFPRADIARLASLMTELAECVAQNPFATLGTLPVWEDVAVPEDKAPLTPLHAAPPPARLEANLEASLDTDIGPPLETEEKLLTLFARILRVSGLSVRDNFFEHGGHSLLVILLLDQIERVFGERLAPVDVYQAPTVRALARIIKYVDERPLDRVLERIRPEGSRIPLFFVGSTDMAPPLVPYMDPTQPVFGLNIFGLLPDKGEVPSLTVHGIAASYIREIRKVQPQGPYRLTAYCRDTMLALEMAQQLHAAGETVDRLIAIDFFWESAPHHSKLIRHLLNVRDFGFEYVREKLREAYRQLYERQARLRAQLALRQKENAAKNEKPLTQTHRNTAYISAYYNAVEAYNIADYPGHVHIIIASEWGIASLPEWDEIAQGGSTLHILKACHHNLWNPPQDQDLARLLTTCLEEEPTTHSGTKAQP